MIARIKHNSRSSPMPPMSLVSSSMGCLSAVMSLKVQRNNTTMSRSFLIGEMCIRSHSGVPETQLMLIKMIRLGIWDQTYVCVLLLLFIFCFMLSANDFYQSEWLVNVSSYCSFYRVEFQIDPENNFLRLHQFFLL